MQDPLTMESRVAAAPAAAAAAAGEPEITTKQLTQLQLTWIRFRRHKPALVGVVIVLFMIALAAFAPLITPESPYNIFSYDITNQNLPPALHPHWYFMLGTDTEGHTMVAQLAW